MAALGWTPDQFWSASVFDITAALDGYRELNDREYVKRKQLERLKTAVDKADGD